MISNFISIVRVKSAKQWLTVGVAALGIYGSALHAEIKTITFIHYNDLHAHMTQHKDIIKTSSGTQIIKAGGLAQIKTIIDGIRHTNCNSIVMNIGDTFHGGVEAMYTSGNAIVDPVNAMGFDIGVPGNWDFAYGVSVTRDRYEKIPATVYAGCATQSQTSSASTRLVHGTKQPNFTHLAANVLNDDLTQSQWLPPTAMINVDGVNVGFIGITSDIVPDMNDNLARGFIFLRGQDNYRDLVNKYAADLRSQGANIVVVMSELGIHKDLKLGAVINAGSVDVFFSAHTHELTLSPISTASGALVVEAGDDIYVGQMDVMFDTDTNSIVDKRWQVKTVTSDTPADPAIQSLVDAARAPFLASNVNMSTAVMTLNQPIDTVIAYVTQPLDRRHALESKFDARFAAAYKKIAGTQLATSPGFRFDSVIPQPGLMLEDNTVTDGDITLEDMYRFFPTYIPLSTATITGSNLKTVIESELTKVFSSDVFLHSGGWYAPFAGLNLTVNLAAADGARVQSMVITDTGHLVQTSDVVSVAGCAGQSSDDGYLCNESGYANVVALPTPGSTRTQWDALNMFIYALQHGYVTNEENDYVQDTNNTLLWPEGDYIQPLYGVY
jgi:2',3'-cyclic-nucleotide 2'-phosphodiesterase (5'-nucleotidase family)